jgi:tetratricopeptide (TPR) repeat protein
MCYHLLGTLDAALYYYQVALQTDERVGDLTDAMIVRSNIGEVLLILGRVNESMSNLEQVVDAQSRHGGLTGVAGLAYVTLSRCELSRGDLSASRKQLAAGRRLLRSAGQSGLLLEADIQGGELLQAEGRVERSVAVSRSALAQAEQMGARLLESRARRVLAEGLTKVGRTAEAQVLLRESIAIARQIAATHEEARSLVALSELAVAIRRNGRRTVSDLRRAEKILGRMGARPEALKAQELLESLAA